MSENLEALAFPITQNVDTNIIYYGLSKHEYAAEKAYTLAAEILNKFK